ncbi:XRE family transcriptional regulator [Glaesserella parasuis]|nr:XRE family transcriptional regulator [Glaesserella parasuis]
MLITTPDMLGNSLRDIRKQKKLSQMQIANQVALRQATISTFEKKTDKATIETLFKLLSGLGYELHIEPRPEKTEGNDEW